MMCHHVIALRIQATYSRIYSSTIIDSLNPWSCCGALSHADRGVIWQRSLSHIHDNKDQLVKVTRVLATENLDVHVVENINRQCVGS